MLAFPKSTVDEVSAERRAGISAVLPAPAPARQGAGYGASIEGVVRKPTARRKGAAA